jgi:hypothetical protein
MCIPLSFLGKGSLKCIPPFIAVQRLSKYIVATNTHSNRRIVEHVCFCVRLCILLTLLGNNSVKTFQWQRKIVEGIIFCAVCVIQNESRQLVLPRTSCFVEYFLLSFGFLSLYLLCILNAELPSFNSVTSCYEFKIMWFIYRVSQEERSVFWEVIVSIIQSKKVYVRVSYFKMLPR